MWKSSFSALCHMALPETHLLWEHWRLVALRGRLSANLFCAVNNDERVWASTAQAVIVRSTCSLANVCVGAVEDDEEGQLAASQKPENNTQKCRDRARVKESGRGGAWLSFLSQGHNSLPCKHRRKAVYQYTECSPWAQAGLVKGILQLTSRTTRLALFSSRYCDWISAKLEILHHRAVMLWQHKIPDHQVSCCQVWPLNQKAICQTPLVRCSLLKTNTESWYLENLCRNNKGQQIRPSPCLSAALDIVLCV